MQHPIDNVFGPGIIIGLTYSSLGIKAIQGLSEAFAIQTCLSFRRKIKVTQATRIALTATHERQFVQPLGLMCLALVPAPVRDKVQHGAEQKFSQRMR